MAEQSGLSPRDFLDKLRNGTLTTPVQFSGMVRGADAVEDHLQFSVDCASWISLPVAMIESIVSLGITRCQDHSHHRARIQLKEPQSDEGRVLSQLLSHLSTESDDFVDDGLPVEKPWCRARCWRLFRNDPVKRKACLDEC
jgi:hypothetical protein